VRSAHVAMPIQMPKFRKQNFIRFDCASPKDEAEKRFHHFTTHVCNFPVSYALTLTRPQVLPVVLKSAVQSANTVVFIPSSFDFIRVQNYLKKHAGVTFAVLSE
jgi:U3 small nucleolar RNA-associated protein 25